MIKVFQEAVKCPVRRKRCRNIKATVVGNKKVVIKVVDQIGNHRKPFAFHHDESTDHGMRGKAPATSMRILRDKGQIETKEKGVIKSGGRLGSKKADILDDFLTIDSNQLLSGRLMLTT